MHIVISGLYAVIVWLSLLAYMVIIEGPILRFLAWTPLFISGAMVAITVLDFGVRGACVAWRRWRPEFKATGMKTD